MVFLNKPFVYKVAIRYGIKKKTIRVRIVWTIYCT